MINQRMLMSGADYFSVESPINPYYHSNIVNQNQAIEEHLSIKRCFENAGIEIIQVAPPKGCQDGVYCANWALISNKKAVMANLPNVRKSEQQYALDVLENLGYETYLIDQKYRFSGQGDALKCGNFLLSGSQYRSDIEAQKIAAKCLNLDLIQLETVGLKDENGNQIINQASGWEDSLFYDIDLALSIINDDLIAYCPRAFTPQSVKIIEELPMQKIEVDYDEAVDGFACNLVSTSKTVIMSKNAPKLRSELLKRGLEVITPNVHELSKGGGYIRCVSLSL